MRRFGNQQAAGILHDAMPAPEIGGSMPFVVKIPCKIHGDRPSDFSIQNEFTYFGAKRNMPVIESHEKFLPALLFRRENGISLFRRQAQRFFHSDLAPCAECLHDLFRMNIVGRNDNDHIRFLCIKHLVVTGINCRMQSEK